MPTIDCIKAKKTDFTVEMTGRDVSILANALSFFRDNEDAVGEALCDDCIERLDEMIKEADSMANKLVEEV